MFFRFACAMALVVLISLIGAALDKEALVLRRRVSQQQYQLDLLLEQHHRLRMQAQQRGTPIRWLNDLEQGRLPLERIARPQRLRPPQTPLLNWTSRPETSAAPDAVPNEVRP